MGHNRIDQGLGLIVAGLCAAVSINAAGQGGLSPAGEPGPTMRTLMQVEPRVPVSQVHTTITARGSYFLTTSLVAIAAANGITINADDVTLDLRGFTLAGIAGSLSGVFVQGEHHNIVIRNGVVRDWGASGVDATNAHNSRLEELIALDNGADGLRIGLAAQVINCTARRNGNIGFFVENGSVVRHSVAWGNNQDGFEVEKGSTVIGCTAKDQDFGDGFELGQSVSAINCTARFNGDQGFDVGAGTTLEGCTASANTTDGIITASGSTIKGCSSNSNGQDGIDAGTGSLIVNCSAYANGDDGLESERGGSIIDSMARRNIFNGILAKGFCRVSGNHCSGNTQAGIKIEKSGTRVDNNSVADNATGILLESTNNLVIRNTASSNTVSFTIPAGNRVGPIDAGTNAPVDHPWANFVF